MLMCGDNSVAEESIPYVPTNRLHSQLRVGIIRYDFGEIQRFCAFL